VPSPASLLPQGCRQEQVTKVLPPLRWVIKDVLLKMGREWGTRTQGDPARR
jgi:hypothetical protein